ncbi:MAG: hypothetical protein KatS3mg099_057 [Candidatus Parcubacteria bacterium]|nr:MAG: hypothetical protein KatS3mg099_057 [Candidatus Parcubacteria bacterium]
MAQLRRFSKPHQPVKKARQTAGMYGILLWFFTFAPTTAYAAACAPGERTICGIIGRVVEIIALAIPLAFAAVLAFFLWSVARFLFAAGDAKAAQEKRSVLLWGVITLAVLVGVWGIVAILQQTFFGQVAP